MCMIVVDIDDLIPQMRAWTTSKPNLYKMCGNELLDANARDKY